MITVSQLPITVPNNILLMCPYRHVEVSACRGDHNAETELRCSMCDAELVIVARQTIYDFDEGLKWLEK
jgi:hypothetical protein